MRYLLIILLLTSCSNQPKVCALPAKPEEASVKCTTIQLIDSAVIQIERCRINAQTVCYTGYERLSCVNETEKVQ